VFRYDVHLMSQSVPQEFLDELYAIPGNRVSLRYLVERLNSSGVTVVAGSRLSVRAGYPVWSELLTKLGQSVGIQSKNPTPEEIIAAAGEMFLYDALEENYGHQYSDPNTLRGPVMILPYLTEGVITMNVDNAIEEAFERAGAPFRHRFVGELPGDATRPWIWKMSGTIDDRSSLLIRQKDAGRHRGPIESVRRAVGETALLFVGQGSSKVLVDVANGMRVVTASKTEWYAVIPVGEKFDVVPLSKLMVRVIQCPEFNGQGEELLLRHLVDKRIPPNGRAQPLPTFVSQQAAAPQAESLAATPQAAPASSAPRVPADLIQSCLNGECVLFAGAGLSARAGVVTWYRFLQDLLAYAQRHQVLDADYASSMNAALQEGERDAVADGLAQAFGDQRNLLHEFLRESFPVGTAVAAAHEALGRVPFSAVVTTNYDSLLEQAFPAYAESGLYTPKDAEALLNALAQKRSFVLKLYGIVDRPDTLLFAPVEYREAVSSNVSFAKFMEGFFFSKNFFFMGLSLEGIQDFLSGFVFRGTSPRKHFALVAVSGSAWKAKAEFLQRRYNVQVIPFPVSDLFAEVDEFVRALAHAARPQAVEASPPQESPGIRRVILEDIGSFERLELDFSRASKWKILLGDNGVGKSTILKAIAVAILGSDARSYAARLVRAGKTRGRVTLITEQNPSGYVTDIHVKDMSSEADVVSIPSRPMEAEGWLALGFSPLRVVTWASPSGPQTIVQKGRPSADDLIPLISGEADPRMKRLKQWIVNLDASAKASQSTAYVEDLAFKGHEKKINSIAFDPTGNFLVSGSDDNAAKLWDTTNGAVIRTLRGHDGPVTSVAFSANGLIASGSEDKTICLWEVESGKPRFKVNVHAQEVRSLALSADARVLVSASIEAGVIVMDTRDGRVLRRYLEGQRVVAINSSGTIIATGVRGGHIALWSLRDAPMQEFGYVGSVNALAFSADGSVLAAGSDDGTIHLYNVGGGQGARILRGGHQEAIHSIAFQPGGRMLASVSLDSLRMWDITTRDQPYLLREATGGTAIAFKPDGSAFATGHQEPATIKLWKSRPSQEGPRPVETIRKFFGLVGTLTDRDDLDFIRVTEDFRIIVRTADVATGVPMEVLSQGMTSLLGWVGVLCQRLKETLQTTTDDPLPTHSFALVLIDELDAHMHPRWQQALVHRLKQAFPNVQFIANTHSPLIVSGLEKDEVSRFAIADGKIGLVDFEADMTLGRADQILTGELFDLSTTLDLTTQETMAEYEALLGKSQRTVEEQLRFAELGKQLEERIPPSPSKPLERRARELLETLQSLDLKSIDEDARGKVEERMARLAKTLGGANGQ